MTPSEKANLLFHEAKWSVRRWRSANTAKNKINKINNLSSRLIYGVIILHGLPTTSVSPFRGPTTSSIRNQITSYTSDYPEEKNPLTLFRNFIIRASKNNQVIQSYIGESSGDRKDMCEPFAISRSLWERFFQRI